MNRIKGLLYKSCGATMSTTVLVILNPAKDETLKAAENARKVEDPLYRVRANFWLTYSEIRLNRLGDGEKLVRENLAFLESHPKEVDNYLTSRMSFAEAELFAAKKNWALSNEKYRLCLQSDPMTDVIWEPMVRIRFGEALANQGLKAEAREQYTQAARIYEKIGNKTHAQIVQKLLNALG